MSDTITNTTNTNESKVFNVYVSKSTTAGTALFTRGSLNKTDPTPTVVGLYILEETGIYPNLGNIDAQAGKLNFASFDGTTWSLVSAEIPEFSANGKVEYGDSRAVSGGEVYDSQIPINSIQNDIINNDNIDIFSVTKIELGKRINQGNGAVYTDANYNVGDFIKLEEDVIYEINPSAEVEFAFYNASKAFVSSNFQTDRILIFKKPVGVDFIRLSYKNDIDATNVFKIKTNLKDTPLNSLVNKIDLASDKWNYIGYYLLYNGGIGYAGYLDATDFIEILGGKTYSLGNSSLSYISYKFYDENLNRIVDSQTAKTFITPLNAKYIRLSRNTSENVQLFIVSEIFNKSKTNILYVSSTDGQFTTIQSAIDYADSLSTRCIIYLDAEKFTITNPLLAKNTPHSLIGVSSQDTIIEGTNIELLQCTGGYLFKDLKFNRLKGSATGEGYALHPDYAGEGIIEFDNVLVVNKFGPCVGSGSHSNQTLRFKNSELRSEDYHLSPTLYWHNNVNNVTGKQRLELLNSIVYSAYERPLQISDQNLNLGNGLNRDSEILAVNCQFYGALYGKSNMLISQPTPIGTKTVAGNIKLSPLSDGNNIDILNY